MREIELGRFLLPSKHEVELRPDETYRTAGILSYGRGLFERPPIQGSETSYKSYFRLGGNQFVYSKLFAWEGAVAVVPAALDGYFVSQEFPTFDVDPRLALPEYVAVLCRWPPLWDRLRAGESGLGGRRKRVHPERLLQTPVPLPDIQEQHRIVDLVTAIDDAGRAVATVIASALASLHATRRELIDSADWPQRPLGEVVRLDARLVDPTADEYAGLPHVGVDRIESATGRLLPLKSAAEDGVTSGKYLFGPDELVYAKIRPNLRKVVWPRIRGLASADAYPLRPLDDVDSVFVQHLLLSDRFSDEAVARSGRTKMPKINRNELLSITVRVPPMREQRRIGSILSALSDVYDAAQSEHECVNKARTSLVHEVISGHRDIPASYDSLLAQTS